MSAREIAEIVRNSAFFYAVMPLVMCDAAFAQTVLKNLEGHEEGYAITHEQFPARFSVDTTEMQDQGSRKRMIAAIQAELLRKISPLWRMRLGGDKNTSAIFVGGGYKFHFAIDTYERRARHKCEPIDDPSLVQYGEVLGRCVRLKVAIATA